MILAPVVIVSNNAFAQTLHDQTLYETVKQTSGSDENAQINVGGAANAIGIDEDTDTVYVANTGSDSVSVISAENNTKIGEDIPVGKNPVAIDVNSPTDTVYVANTGSDSVSVISAENNTKIKDIPVGDGPSAIDIDLSDTVYVANTGSDSVSVISAENNTKIGEDIPVGVSPSAIGVNPFTDTVYVAAYFSNTMSVISAENNTKIKDIPVGDRPSAIRISHTGTVYVANSDSNTMSVISGENNTKIKDIPVGDGPSAIDVTTSTHITISLNASRTAYTCSATQCTLTLTLPSKNLTAFGNTTTTTFTGTTETVYVANSDSDTVSVISGENYTKIGEDIPVGDGPSAIGVNFFTDAVYVVNTGSGGVSVIDATANKVVAGVTFQVNPFDSGYILCDGLTTPSPIGQYIYVYSGAQCTAKPNEGFEFVSWEENLPGNSSQLITVSRPASPLDSIASFFGTQLDEPEARVNITKFGTFTANFKELPPAFPPEYLIPLYGIIASTIIGWSIPSIISWARSKRGVGKLNYYHKQITSLYGDGKLDEDDIEPLNRLRTNIVDAYSKGNLNEKHYESLRNEISTLYEKIFRKKIGDLLNNGNSSSATKKLRQEQLTQIRNEVEYAYSEGKINEKHYDLLNKAISNLESKEE